MHCHEIWCRPPTEEGPKVLNLVGQERSILMPFRKTFGSYFSQQHGRHVAFFHFFSSWKSNCSEQAFPVQFIGIYKRGASGKATDVERNWCHYRSRVSVSAGAHAHLQTGQQSTDQTFAPPPACTHSCTLTHTHKPWREIQYGKHAFLMKYQTAKANRVDSSFGRMLSNTYFCFNSNLFRLKKKSKKTTET